MIRTYRYPLRPTRQQQEVLTRWLGICCDLYNAALQERRDAWRIARKSISRFDQNRALTEIRAEDHDVRAVPVKIARSALHRVDRAFQEFFKRSERGRQPGYPRFRARRHYDSFWFSRFCVRGNRITIRNLGPVKFHWYRTLGGVPQHVTIGRDSTGKWYASFRCDVGAAPEKVAVRSAVGIDLGLTTFATLSDGAEVENPRWFRTGQRTLKRRQQIRARRQRGSASRERARVQVAKAYAHVANQRKDFAWKLSKQLLERYDLIAYEDLAIARMVHGTFAKSIHDAGWGLFLRCLASKAESAGKHVIAVDPRGTTQRCSGCGTTVRKDLSQRTHACTCGVTLGRDHNAAINILALGRSAVETEKFSVAEAERAVGAHYPELDDD